MPALSFRLNKHSAYSLQNRSASEPAAADKTADRHNSVVGIAVAEQAAVHIAGSDNSVAYTAGQADSAQYQALCRRAVQKSRASYAFQVSAD